MQTACHLLSVVEGWQVRQRLSIIYFPLAAVYACIYDSLTTIENLEYPAFGWASWNSQIYGGAAHLPLEMCHRPGARPGEFKSAHAGRDLIW